MRVEHRCPICASDRKLIVCSAAEVAAQIKYLHIFHRRRLQALPTDDGSLADRAEFTQDYATAIDSCECCGFVFRESHPPAGAVTESYARDQYGPERLAALFESQLEWSRSKLRRVRELLPGAIAAPAIIEVGSFVGGFLVAARELGWSAIGVDPGDEVDQFCRGKGLEVIRTTADKAPIAADTADLVAIWNTFDQLPDPRPTLVAVQRWLRPGGLLVIRVPHGACFWSMVQRLRRSPRPLRSLLLTAMAWNNLLGFPYLSGHSVRTLDRLLMEHGFDRVAVDGDTLVRLADERTRAWARGEESIIKTAWRGLAGRRPEMAPWLDVYFRRRARSA